MLPNKRIERGLRLRLRMPARTIMRGFRPQKSVIWPIKIAVAKAAAVAEGAVSVLRRRYAEVITVS
jgi:hypothetical protein